jgi:hypothetical protein
MVLAWWKMEKHINGYFHKGLMERLNYYGPVTDFVHRLRQTRCLIDQINTDYEQFNRMRNSQAVQENSLKQEELFRLLGWLEQELDALRELQGREIENVTCGRIGQIENEIRALVPRNIPFSANRRRVLDLF